jgi:hypothetical protein
MKTGKAQPAPMTSNLPGSFKGNAMGDGVEPSADGRGGMTASQSMGYKVPKQPSYGVSTLPGGFVSVEAGANPDGPMMLDNGPRGDESVTTDQMGEGQKKRTVTGRDQSPYDVK